MRDRLLGAAMIAALVTGLGLAVPISTSAQDKKDNSTPTTADGGESLATRSVAHAVPAATNSVKPNSPQPAPADSDSWSGGYIGGHVGYGSGDANTSFTPLPNATSFIDLRPTTLSPDLRGMTGGAQGGYNWQSGKFVFGGEASFSWSNIDGTATVSPIIMNNGSPFASNGFLLAHQEVKWFGTLRPRAGVALDRVLVYGTGGLAYGNLNYTANADFRPSAGSPILFFQYPVSFSKTRTGWTAGGGAEVRVSRHWSLRLEYLYVDLGNESIIANPVPANPPFQLGYRWETRAHTFSAGINFRF
ncbi:MAG: outer membrane protein [Acidobacteriota bacterium]